ncbi:proton-conducting transporter membrane subunit, partial [Bacillaceae bacterium S4-13-58]
GAPTPVTAFLSVVSKAAGFTLIIRLFVTIFTTTPGLEMNTSIIQSLMIFISVLAGITMIIGNTVALRQRNIKRLFAYSSIAHAGYLLVPLVGFTALTPMIFESTWFYLVAYLFMNLGAFTVIQLMIEKSKSEDLTIFSGLFYRSPLLAIVMTVFLVSLAGIPGTAGFIGKLNIFLGALYGAEPHYVLAGVMMATTVISYFYYFGIMTQMFSRPASSYSKIKIPAPLLIAMIICAAGTLVLGIFPDLAFSIFGDLNAAEVLMGVLG